MAYMSQERKASIAARVKPILKQYGVKGTLSVHNHSTIVLTITSGAIDFVGTYNRVVGQRGRDFQKAEGYLQVNEYYLQEQFDGAALSFVQMVKDALNLVGDKDANFDNSEPQTDYFHVGWYVSINVGKWDKPYQLTAESKAA